MLDRERIIERMNALCSEGTPFVFVVDYKGVEGMVLTIDELGDSEIYCSLHGVELNDTPRDKNSSTSQLNITPLPFVEYERAFNTVQQEILSGNSYLLNLTFATSIGSQVNLSSIYNHSVAPYKMLFSDKFVFHSPEPFIKIRDNKIYSYPMKGTIDATVDDAENRLLNSTKEQREHHTIVDLIRNDLSKVSRGVTVDRLRYTERIKTSRGEILQSSSEISGSLAEGWQSGFGDILFALLPAGSISGAPKEKTLEIISESETTERGFYCGVMGLFDGEAVDSGVIIRYVEKGDDGEFYYRSGGGITALSTAEDEYNELIQKIYVPQSTI